MLLYSSILFEVDHVSKLILDKLMQGFLPSSNSCWRWDKVDVLVPANGLSDEASAW